VNLNDSNPLFLSMCLCTHAGADELTKRSGRQPTCPHRTRPSQPPLPPTPISLARVPPHSPRQALWSRGCRATAKLDRGARASCYAREQGQRDRADVMSIRRDGQWVSPLAVLARSRCVGALLGGQGWRLRVAAGHLSSRDYTRGGVRWLLIPLPAQED
jgi:hypothetical protein